MNTQVQKGERKIKKELNLFVSFFKGFIYTVNIFPGAIKKDFVLLLLLSHFVVYKKKTMEEREKECCVGVVLFHFVSKVSYRVLNVLCFGMEKTTRR